MKTKQLVYEMLTENTGKHFLDSGGSEGRGWQRNQKKTIEAFENEDEELYQLDAKYKEIYRTVSVFHFLTNNLEIDDICEEFNRLQDESNNWDADADVYGVSKEAWEMLDEFHDIEIERTWNTYNGESDLSQILQGANLTINDEQYILLQIHNGADARGGYTDAKLFKMEEDMIHEYLQEWKDSSEVEEDLKEGYIEILTDYWDENRKYTNEEAINILEL
tara:strand:+ start:2398 stop:3057 length:660 start_codon:yes stop_codon:yes gene_type:complete